MTRTKRSPIVRALVASATAVALSATLSVAAPTQASAATRSKTITRSAVMDRARLWVKHRVPYSQRGYHKGYRRDCSGFVSWAWKVGRSYTTRSLHRVSHRVARSSARPGDAVLYRGHVVIFGGWKSKSRGTFYAYEEPSWGKVARKRVKSMRGGRVMRRDGIRSSVVRVATKPATTPAPVVTTPTEPVATAPIEGTTPVTVVTAAAVEAPEALRETAMVEAAAAVSVEPAPEVKAEPNAASETSAATEATASVETTP